ncbi:MAG: type II secretion system F family protein [Vampirovibrionales bacterium]|nr:type II secretion system F family protein [Vampirovibrionales bacterium]
MHSYEYQALQMTDKKKLKGVINANSESEARVMLREKKLIVTQMKKLKNMQAESTHSGANWLKRILEGFNPGGSLQNLLVFSRNMAIMSKAGIPLTDALIYFENFVTHAGFKATIKTIRGDIMSGMSFSQALGKHPQVFNSLFVNLVRAGEASGDLDATLIRLMEQMQRNQKVKNKIGAAMVYPAVVLAILGLVLILMFTIIIPTFEDIYKSMNVKLPLITQMMVFISSIVRNYWYALIPGFVAAGYFAKTFLTSAQGKFAMQRLSLKVPVVKDLVLLMSNAHFFSSFGISFAAGLPVSDALLLSTSTIQNDIIRSKFNQVYSQIQIGQSLANSLVQIKQVPDLVLLMVSAGEESGELERMLKLSEELLEEEVERKVDALTAMIEPVLMVVLGAVVGVLALSIYLPLFSMYEHM